jgi:hypothetical protein
MWTCVSVLRTSLPEQAPNPVSEKTLHLFLFGEKILVETLEIDGPAGTDADIVLNHEIGKTLPIDQDHALRQVAGIVDRVLTEGRGRDENTFCCGKPNKTSNEA